jgi:hypothetical protein
VAPIKITGGNIAIKNRALLKWIQEYGSEIILGADMLQ